MTIYQGCDISSLQGNVDFNALVKKGISFTILRNFVGNDFADSKYKTNLIAAQNAGLKVMCYNFCYPLPSTGSKDRDPKGQANLHFNTSQGQIAAADIEWPEPADFAKWGCSPSQIRDWCLTYLQEYERISGRKPIIYTYPDFAKNVKFSSDFANYDLWIASYANPPTIPAPWKSYIMQQNGISKTLLSNGIPVDTDVMNDLSLIWAPIIPAQSPPSTPEVITTVIPAIVNNQTVGSVIITSPPVVANINNTSDTIDKIETTAINVFKYQPVNILIQYIIKFVKGMFHIE
jgi:GH25 family lysozyme M1 (1,4-beta-N-acetylmuramidase)